MIKTTNEQLAALPLLLPGEIAGVDWTMHDDLCNCLYQRIGEWRNPYFGKTMRVRLCCMWAKLDELFPGLVMTIDGYFDPNRGESGEFVEGAIEWDSLDADMPRAVWYRQIACITGKTLDEVRQEYSDREPPKALLTPEQRAAIALSEAWALAEEQAEGE